MIVVTIGFIEQRTVRQTYSNDHAYGWENLTNADPVELFLWDIALKTVFWCVWNLVMHMVCLTLSKKGQKMVRIIFQ